MSNTKSVSKFGQAALVLDSDFNEFEQLAQDIKGVSINTDSGFEKARRILSKLDECGQRITSGMQNLASTLDEVRAKTEETANFVAERALAIQTRQEESDRIAEKLRAFGEMVRKVTTTVGQLKPQIDSALSDEERQVLADRLPEFSSQLGFLVEEALRIKEAAQNANLKTFEKNADALRQSLQAAKHRLELFVGRQPGLLN